MKELDTSGEPRRSRIREHSGNLTALSIPRDWGPDNESKNILSALLPLLRKLLLRDSIEFHSAASLRGVPRNDVA